MKRALLLLLVSASARAGEDELVRLSQRLFDAVAPGDRAVWQEILADDCIYTDEEGATKTKADLMKELAPLPAGVTGSGKIVDPVVRRHGDVGVVAYMIVEHEVFHGVALETRYRETDVYVGKKLVAAQTQVIPADPPAVAVAPARLGDYVGRYALADLTLEVRRDGDRLLLVRGGAPPRELVGFSDDVFFARGVPGLYLFQRAGGRVDRLVSRRKGNDLVWTRLNPEK